MKKTLLALSLLSACGMAMAQNYVCSNEKFQVQISDPKPLMTSGNGNSPSIIVTNMQTHEVFTVLARNVSFNRAFSDIYDGPAEANQKISGIRISVSPYNPAASQLQLTGQYQTNSVAMPLQCR